jgi:hypothetical protein
VLTWGAILERGSPMKHGIITLACLILLALTWAVPETSAPDEQYGPTDASVRAAREKPTLVAHRRHCHSVKGHYRRDTYGRRVYVPAHRHCHTTHRPVA